MSEWLDGFSMAWGMFLAIPCPLRRWNEKAREKMLVCLPLVGLAVGGIWLGLYLLLRHAAIGGLYAFLMAALPWLVTGFMHLDGYMDVCDAVLSRRELATRQRILKDSHCGAFAVIGMVLLALCQWSVFLSGSAGESLWGLLLIPVATRALCGTGSAEAAAHGYQPIRRHGPPRRLCRGAGGAAGGGDRRTAGPGPQLRPLGGSSGLRAGGMVRLPAAGRHER